jgi:hypothetical protein
MKKTLLAITMVVALGGLAFAGSSRGPTYLGNSSGPITGNTTANILDTRGAVIYNVVLNAANNNATMTVYDASGLYNGTPEVGQNGETIVMEIEVATAGNSATVNMDAAPLQTYQGVTVSVVNGVGFLNYNP